MKKILLLTILFGNLTFLFAQKEPQVHLESIRNSTFKKVTPQGVLGDSAFLEYVLQFLIEESQDEMFVSNRDLLKSLCLSYCGRMEAEIHDTLTSGKQVRIDIFTKTFDPDQHEFLYYEDEDSLIKAIDGMRVFGAVDKMPETLVDSIAVTIGKKKLKIPPSAYEDLFDPNLCSAGFFQKPVSAYPSLNGDFLYVYLYGGESSSMYFAKLIFNKKGYIKKIVAEYEDLIQFGAIREDFIGY